MVVSSTKIATPTPPLSASASRLAVATLVAVASDGSCPGSLPAPARLRDLDHAAGRVDHRGLQLEPVGHLISVMNDSGFEVRHEENLREHYALTLKGWCENLEEHWDEAVGEVGLGRARVWRLYMAASRLGFERDNIQLHQVLGVKLLERGRSGFPLRGW